MSTRGSAALRSLSATGSPGRIPSEPADPFLRPSKKPVRCSVFPKQTANPWLVRQGFHFFPAAISMKKSASITTARGAAFARHVCSASGCSVHTVAPARQNRQSLPSAFFFRLAARRRTHSFRRSGGGSRRRLRRTASSPGFSITVATSIPELPSLTN